MEHRLEIKNVLSDVKTPEQKNYFFLFNVCHGF